MKIVKNFIKKKLSEKSTYFGALTLAGMFEMVFTPDTWIGALLVSIVGALDVFRNEN